MPEQVERNLQPGDLVEFIWQLDGTSAIRAVVMWADTHDTVVESGDLPRRLEGEWKGRLLRRGPA